MDLLMDFLESEQVEMLKNDIKLTAIGEREFLPMPVRQKLEAVDCDRALQEYVAGSRCELRRSARHGARRSSDHGGL